MALEFTLDATDTGLVCHGELRQQIREWLDEHGRHQESSQVWAATWEALLNAIAYGSHRGDVISIRMRLTRELSVEIEQSLEWRDWDECLGDERRSALLAMDVAPERFEAGGTVVMSKLASSVIVSRQGRSLTMLF